MNEVKQRIFEKEMKYKNTVILKYTIKYPEIIASLQNCKLGKEIFNQYYKVDALKLREYTENELYNEAKQLYEYNTKNGYPIMVYEVVLDYTITYNRNCIISLYQDKYIFTGGAHGNTTRTGGNWNLTIGKQIKLYQLYEDNPYFILDILKQIDLTIKAQIENGENQYFDNYCCLVIENFNTNSYYITPEGVVIFFQQYDIAPYSSGIPTFTIKSKKY